MKDFASWVNKRHGSSRLILRTSHHVKDLNVVGILINNNENMKKIQFKAGRIPNVIHFFRISELVEVNMRLIGKGLQ